MRRPPQNTTFQITSPNISKAEGLIVALSGDLERPLVGQSGTFVEAGSANLISIQVETRALKSLNFPVGKL